ncbi:hypothetical protein [Methanoplanus endosymbiosus]|uniref:Uncharacterized protein n=1 Tax=Methanoplanus endosymbiosus TaxID=33865 RepID=A0A9E7PK66_9EURY|nr:hypothetical protein [Methanoplanus endosymbiosus]UUX91504.1 hypothetical protein L6E24_08980 [Methanoplanus endosymbiosus]
MKIKKSNLHKFCKDGSTRDDLVMDEPVSIEFIKYLSNFGEVKIREGMRMTPFSFDKPDFISIKGILGDDEIEMRVKKEFQRETSGYFDLLLFNYNDGTPDVNAMRGREAEIRAKIEE